MDPLTDPIDPINPISTEPEGASLPEASVFLVFESGKKIPIDMTTPIFDQFVMDWDLDETKEKVPCP